MAEELSQIPERLAIQTPEGISRMSDLLAGRLKTAGDASYKTPAQDQQEFEYITDKLTHPKGGFLGLGKKRVDISDPDELWVTTQALYPPKEADIAYEIVRRAQVIAEGGKIPDNWDATRMHKALVADPDTFRLDLLNQRQLITGEHAALPLLKKIIDEEEIKEEEGMVELEDYAEISLYGGTHIGRRDVNQDTVGWVQPDIPKDAEGVKKLAKGTLLVVADGIGGHQKGEVASNMATREMLDRFANLESIDYPEEFLTVALEEINNAVYTPLDKGREEGTMGTTLVAGLIKGHELTVAHVGDSRAYIFRDKKLRRLTRDHSLREGGGPTAPQNLLTEAIGISPVLQDVYKKVGTYFRLHKGDLILLCTDGLWGALSEKAIANILVKNKYPKETVEKLVQEALNSGGEDNIGLVLAKVEDLIEGKKIKLQTTLPTTEPNSDVGDEPEEIPATQDLSALAEEVLTHTPSGESSSKFTPRQMIWRNADSDIPVTVTGIAGVEDGKTYYKIEGYNTALPENELVNLPEEGTKSTPTAAPKSPDNDNLPNWHFLEPENTLETVLSSETATPEDIITELRKLTEDPASSTESTIRHQKRANNISRLEKKLSQVLKLPEDESSETLAKEEEIQHASYALAAFPIYRRYTTNMRPTDQQIALLKRMFTAAPQDLQEKLASYTNLLQKNVYDTEHAAFLVERGIEQAAGLSSFPDYRLNAHIAQTIYEEALQDPQSSSKEVIQAFRDKNKDLINRCRGEDSRNHQLQSYIEGLAHQTGIKINYDSDLSGNLLEEIPQNKQI